MMETGLLLREEVVLTLLWEGQTDDVLGGEMNSETPNADGIQANGSRRQNSGVWRDKWNLLKTISTFILLNIQ